ncbi:MAG TPA: hypothetical protein VNG53_05740 [Bacteroidia bacterium]|nr:hypothetical protein [Bacteroidia bacterium]
MRKICLSFSTIFLCVIAYSQTDSTHYSSRAFVGWELGGGIRQMDFSALRKYEYFLNQPPNIQGGIHTSLYLGNPDKFFLSLFFGTTLVGEKTGVYNNSSIRASGNAGYFGALLSYQVYRNNDRKFLKAIYFSSGVNYTTAITTSKVKGKTILNADTSFFIEYSKVKNILINPEIMIELFNLSNKNSFPSFPFMIKLGYNIQFQDPKWTYYDKASQNPTALRSVNLGGFYATLGINVWLKKGVKWF